MSRRSKTLQLRLFGLNREEVDHRLQKLRQENEKKEKEINDKINKLRDENQRLLRELEALKKESRSAKSEEFMNFAIGRTQGFTEIIKNSIKDELSDMKITYREQESAYDKKIDEYDEMIRDTQDYLNSLLKNIMEKSKNFSQRVEEFIENKNESFENELQYSKFADIEKILSFADIKKFNIEKKKDNKKENELEGTRDEKKDNYMKLDTVVSDDNLEILTEQKMSSDRNKMPEQIHTKGSEEDLFNGFWNNEEFETEKEETKEEVCPEKIIDERETNSKIPLKSEAITSDINNIRYKYLVGKIAGENLADSKNNIIITKGGPITADVIKTAESEGKLAELIVNMTVPGIGI